MSTSKSPWQRPQRSSGERTTTAVIERTNSANNHILYYIIKSMFVVSLHWLMQSILVSFGKGWFMRKDVKSAIELIKAFIKTTDIMASNLYIPWFYYNYSLHLSLDNLLILPMGNKIQKRRRIGNCLNCFFLPVNTG